MQEAFSTAIFHVPMICEILSMSCFNPGMSCLLQGLASSEDLSCNVEIPWQEEYSRGFAHGLFVVKLKRSPNSRLKTMAELSYRTFERFGIVIVCAMTVEQSVISSPSAILPETCIACVVARNSFHASSIGEVLDYHNTSEISSKGLRLSLDNSFLVPEAGQIPAGKMIAQEAVSLLSPEVLSALSRDSQDVSRDHLFADRAALESISRRDEKSQSLQCISPQSFFLDSPPRHLRDHIVLVVPTTDYAAMFIAMYRKRELWHHNYMNTSHTISGPSDRKHPIVILCEENYDPNHFRSSTRSEMENIFFCLGSALDATALMQAGGICACQVIFSSLAWFLIF